jgi:hypothetical protein
MGLSFPIDADPRQRTHSQVRVPRDSRPYVTVSDSRLLQTERPGSCIYIPQEQGGQIMPQALGSLFVASYDSQSYGGGIWPRLHTGESEYSRCYKNVLIADTVPHRTHTKWGTPILLLAHT